MDSSIGFVYAVLNPGVTQIKFGHSVEPERRLMALNTGSSSRLELLGYWPGSADDEKAIHFKFAQYRLGGEWFVPAFEICHFLFERCGVDLFHLRPRAVSQTVIRVDPAAKTQILRPELTAPMTGIEFLDKYKIPLSGVVFHRAVSRVAGFHNVERQTRKIVTRVYSTGRKNEREVWVYPEFVWLAAYSIWARRKRNKSIAELETEIRLATAEELPPLSSADLAQVICKQSAEIAQLRQQILTAQRQINEMEADASAGRHLRDAVNNLALEFPLKLIASTKQRK